MSLFPWKKNKTSIESVNIPAKTVSVLMQDGSVEEYPEHFIITDDKNCVVCNSKLYHTSLDCNYLQTEMSSGTQVKAMKIYDAEAQCFEYCYECQKEREIHDR